MFKQNVCKAGIAALAVASTMAFSAAANAAISSYSTNFNTDFNGSPTFTGWGGFSDNGGFPGGYSFAPSTSGPQITALANDGGPNQYMNFYANYDNAPVHTGAAPRPQEAISVFVNQAFTAADTAAGDTWRFDFDYALGTPGPSGSTQVGAFIRVFDPVFNLLAEQTFNTLPGATAGFQGGSLSQTLNPLWTNGFIQFGFNNLVGNYENSGMFYDNVKFYNPAVVPVPAAVWLFGSALVGLVGMARRRKS